MRGAGSPPATSKASELSQVAEVLAGLEADGLARRDAHLGACARVTADPLLAGLYLENAESAELDSLAPAHRFLHGVENRLDRHDGPHPGDVGNLRDIIDDVGFDHSDPRLPDYL